MIELPALPAPNGASPAIIDFGFHQRSPLGGATTRIDRAGSRYRVGFTYPPMVAANSRVFVSRLVAAKMEGALRVPMVLLESQGAPGSPVVDGAGQAGKVLALRGLTRGYMCKEGYWLSIQDENGRHYLHNVHAGARADASGNLEITLNEMLRWPFANGATVHLAKPMVEGFIDGQDWGWMIPLNGLIAPEFTIEEAA